MILEKLFALLRRYRQVILYLIFGALTTLINLLSYLFFTRFLSLEELTANILAWVLSVLFAFFTNKLWVFESRSRKKSVFLREAAAFFGGRIFSLLVDEAMLWCGLHLLHWNDFVVKVLANIVVIVLNFFISKWLVFRKSRTKEA